MTTDIWNISHTDINSQLSFFEMDYHGKVIIPDTSVSEELKEIVDEEPGKNDSVLILNRKIKVSQVFSVPVDNKTKMIDQKRNILTTVHIIIQKPFPLVYEVVPSLFSSPVDHFIENHISLHFFHIRSFVKLC
eukprot:TRINITY_DN5958_c0_g1_i3.p1 TRINITY_DN5958_c0_g1~~TRINITY_DN5958_c0_g1_i3.p1  ORF type:complete len:133 (+),score=4.16 TRINITY_DN5958_c0_g1_i3:399-797(+)